MFQYFWNFIDCNKNSSIPTTLHSFICFLFSSMGLTTSISSKGVVQYGHPQYRASVVTMHGYRQEMEDGHSIVPGEDRSLFAVYDGHSGEKTAEYLEKTLPNRVKNCKTNKQWIRAFLQMDADLKQSKKDEGSGSTVALASLDHKTNQLTVVHLGDSRVMV